MNRKRLIACAAIFVIAETLAILYALWPTLFATTPEPRGQIRIGIVPAISKNRSTEQWQGFVKEFDEDLDCPLAPYFANSHEEAISGLLNGSLDLLYTNPAVFLSVDKLRKLKPWFYHKLSKREKEMLRSVLVSSKPVSHISETKGFKLMFTDPNSMTGCIVPSRFIENKLPQKISAWFSGIAYAHNDAAAFESLLGGRADIIACDRLSLEEAVALYGEKAKSLHMVWMSLALPENLICSLDSLPTVPEKSKTKLLDASKELALRKFREEFLTEKSMCFMPIDYSYTEMLISLEKYLHGDDAKSAPTESLPAPQKTKRL